MTSHPALAGSVEYRCFPSTVTLSYLSALMRSHLTTSNGFAGKGSKALRSASNRSASLSPLR